MSSVEASATALAGRGSNHSGESTNDDYKIVLPQMPTGITSETSVLLHCDLKGRPYRIQDFRQEMARCGVLGDIAALGAYQMNHVWMATLRTAEAKRRLVDAKELQVKGLRCLVVDPSITEVRLRLHWIPYDVPDDVVRKELEPYGKVLEVSREKWNVEGFQGIESTTRCARMTLNEGGTADTMPHQLRIQGGNVLVVIPGRAPLCLRCKRTGHIRRECRAPKCSECFRFGHYGTECVRSYARVASGAGPAEAETNDHAMDAEEAERTIQGLAPEVSTPAKERKSEGSSSLGATRENGGQPEGAPPSGADVKPSDAGADKESNDASTNGPSDMDDTSESTKRAFDDDTTAGNGARQLHPWMERTKKGRYQPAPNDPKEERRRRESK
ncbi:uncharacterized protein LOC120838989 [Ixodes scapularis]|uniref:uncharacterized protein LOC120838989 n=1 Tax=Ixodes scapularis TaxID=6945 RepID=UPI001A9ED40D|nr:uncharacterized protein LOC120838989 [Ixodes scapularis]